MKLRLSIGPLAFALLLLCFAFGFAQTTRAEDASVTATLSDQTTTVGEAVELQIAIRGSKSNVTAPEVRVDGLDISHTGESSNSQIQMNGLSFTATVTTTHSYSVLPRRVGTFIIPPLKVEVGGKPFTTQPLTLTVTNGQAQPGQGGAGGQQAGQGSQGAADSKFAIAEWVLPKTTAYVGEAIPAELRLYVDEQIRSGIQQFPSVQGDGFLVQKLTQPTSARVTKNGRAYNVSVFKTAITAVKPGKLTIPSSPINFIAVLPQKRQRRANVPPGFPDVFNDPFFSQQFAVEQQVAAHTDPLDLDVKPLPLANRPKGFSGAVGQFTLKTSASPLSVHAGDPITLTSEVAGIGNFDRMTGPRVAEERGWKAYPPSSKFKADDDVGISGVKTFETALIPNGPQDALPNVEFSYFDPSQEKYVTLTGERIPVTVEGSLAPSPTPTPNSTASVPTPSATPAGTPQPKPNDILFIRTDSTGWGATFEPVWRTTGFWLAQLASLTALLIFTGWQIRQSRLGDLRAQRFAALRQAKAESTRILNQATVAPGDFYDASMRVLQIDTALRALEKKQDCDPSTLDAESVCAGRSLDPETATEVRRLFAAHDELRYAGVGGSTTESISPDRRKQVLQLIERFEKNHA